MAVLCMNCKAKLSCGCQKRTASNGASVCTNCITAYETALSRNRTLSTPSSGTAPSNVTVMYNGPGRIDKL